jgi:hypothetical protein
MYLDSLHQVYPMARIRPRILFIIKELMIYCWHHMAHHARAMQQCKEFMQSNLLIVSGFMIYDNSMMGPINT